MFLLFIILHKKYQLTNRNIYQIVQISMTFHSVWGASVVVLFTAVSPRAQHYIQYIRGTEQIFFQFTTKFTLALTSTYLLFLLSGMIYHHTYTEFLSCFSSLRSNVTSSVCTTPHHSSVHHTVLFSSQHFPLPKIIC